jgi:hypothetical protein
MTYTINTKADTRSNARRLRTWTLEATSQEDAIDQARELHLKVVGWNSAITVRSCEVTA